MNTRTVLLAALLAPALTALPAHAGKPVCFQVTDPAGDAKMTDGSSHGPIDIVSADIATGKRNLVAVLRLKSLAIDPALAAGATYLFAWQVGGVAQDVTLTVYSDGTRAATFDPNTALSANGDTLDVPVVVDTATSTITWTVPRSADPALRKSGVKVSRLSLATKPSINTHAAVDQVDFSGSFALLGGGDDAASGRTYVDKTPTCVKGA